MGGSKTPAVNTTASTSKTDVNQFVLRATMERLRSLLSDRIEAIGGASLQEEVYKAPAPAVLESSDGRPSALEVLVRTFRLSPFEADLLVLCAGVEFDAGFADLCRTAQGKSDSAYPTFGFALSLLPQAHWSALAPSGPLRYWKLIQFDNNPGLTRSPLRVDERILHYLAGVTHIDERLADVITPLPVPAELVPSHRLLAERIVSLWSQPRTGAPLPLVQLCGADMISQRAIASAACSALKTSLMLMPVSTLPSQPAEINQTIRLWERESVLGSLALLLEDDESDRSDHFRQAAIRRVLNYLRGPIILSVRDRYPPLHRLTVTYDVDVPTLSEQKELWNKALSGILAAPDELADQLVSRFNIGPHQIYSAAAEAAGQLKSANGQEKAAKEATPMIWDSCRSQIRPQLDDVAQRIEPGSGWDDLVLPNLQQDLLRDMAAHVRQRIRVYNEWAFASRGSRGLGISALFSGSSGTGKTMAAEVLAAELHLDLYRIDLSSVVSKYIGETEKNLRRVFDAADRGGVILLFDEADALFGKRSEVKDSHDRYANIEVSYLLQRMESYRGLAILTTNLKSALDPAFLRRIRFIVQFPFPDADQRTEIWRRIFPKEVPTEKLDFAKLGLLNMAGGNIRSIAINAAFLAADAGQAVRMSHILHAARTEYLKLEKTLTDAEIEGWELS